MLWALVGALGVLVGMLTWGEWGLEQLGWYQLSAPVRLVVVFSLPALGLGLLTVNWPTFRGQERVCTKRIEPEEFDSQKQQYTRKCLATLRSSPEYAKFRQAVDSQRVRSAFEE